ncbi:MAG: transposase [Myxococcales bacterium]|nr:transposase [Myxococcales bacterium]
METAEQRKKRQRRNFTDEFKAGAVRLVVKEGKSIAEVSRDLELVPSALGKWVKQAKVDRGDGPPGALTTEEREELGRLRKQVRKLEIEREILKKAAAFFAKESE